MVVKLLVVLARLGNLLETRGDLLNRSALRFRNLQVSVDEEQRQQTGEYQKGVAPDDLLQWRISKSTNKTSQIGGVETTLLSANICPVIQSGRKDL